MVKHIETTNEFKSETEKGLVLVDFFATWCGPCRMLAPVLEEIDQQNLTQAKIVKVDVDKVGDVAAKYHVQVIPTLVLLKDGVEIKRQSGFMPKNHLVNFINQ